MKRQSIRIREHGSKKSTCYVTTFQGPLSVWNAYHRGAYGDGMTSERVSAYSSIEWGDVIQAGGGPMVTLPRSPSRSSSTSMRTPLMRGQAFPGGRGTRTSGGERTRRLSGPI